MPEDQDMSGLINLLGRGLIALLFVPAGIAKVTPGPFLEHMAAHGVPGLLLPLVGVFEVVAGLLILAGPFTRYSAAALGLFCVATAAIFHLNFADHAERTLFLKTLRSPAVCSRWRRHGRSAAIWMMRRDQSLVTPRSPAPRDPPVGKDLAAAT
jgi:putative oxidoreductase